MKSRIETFRWEYLIFDVTAMNDDLQSGELRATSVTLDRPTIDWYCEHALGLNDTGLKIFPQMPDVDLGHARQLEAPRTEQPIILAEVYLGDLAPIRAALHLDTLTMRVVRPEKCVPPQIVVPDGNHRLAFAFLRGADIVNGVLLRSNQTGKYLRNA
jgi:hypothetical protein